MLRLTTARYYTPSGRCVQKPYKPGDEEDYEADLLLRAEHGEYFSADSIRTTGEKYKTRLGRTVYGGGGIVPDIFIARDTLGMTSYFKEAYLGGLLFQYAYDFVDRNRNELNKCNDLASVSKYLKKKNIIEGFASYAEKAGLKRRNLMIQSSRNLLTTYISSAIISDVFDDGEAVEYVNQTDAAVLRATSILTKGNALPQVNNSKGKAQAKALIEQLSAPYSLALWRTTMPWYKPLFMQYTKVGATPSKNLVDDPQKLAICLRKLKFVNA